MRGTGFRSRTGDPPELSSPWRWAGWLASMIGGMLAIILIVVLFLSLLTWTSPLEIIR